MELSHDNIYIIYIYIYIHVIDVETLVGLVVQPPMGSARLISSLVVCFIRLVDGNKLLALVSRPHTSTVSS